MGREVRRVPAGWVHPKYTEETARTSRHVGTCIPLHEGRDLASSQKEWDKSEALWREGLRPDRSQKQTNDPYQFSEYYGSRPTYDEHMPNWPEDQRTHYMMYENTTEGTPISPVFATPEELARWLADNNASAFGHMTATYDQWLRVCQGGWAPSMVIQCGTMSSGVAALEDKTSDV